MSIIKKKKNEVKPKVIAPVMSDSDIESDPEQISDDVDYPMTGDDIDRKKSKRKGRKAGTPSDMVRAFASILAQEKPKNKKHIVLSKAKRPVEKNKPKITFKIVDENEKNIVDIKEEKPDVDDLNKIQERKAKRNKELQLRIKPNLMSKERERAFKKIATKGVVQLFNAVRTQQKELVNQLDEAGPLDHRRDAVLKNVNKKKFLDVLMGGNRAKSELIDGTVKDEIKEESDDDTGNKSQWEVLRDDFMVNKKLSHWDKDDDSSDGDINENIDSDE